MDSNLSNEKVDIIISNTIIEFNRILLNWNINNKKYDYDDIQSLLKTVFSKSIKQHFDNKYIKQLKYFKPLCVIKNNRICSIQSNVMHYEFFTVIHNRLKNFEFESFDKKLKLDEFLSESKPKVITSLFDISFDDIKKINFKNTCLV